MLHKKSFFLVLFFVGSFVYGQDKYPTSARLKHLLTRQTRLKGKVYRSTTWFTVETDSSFQEADTLVFYNNPAYMYGKHICNSIDWNFYKKDAFSVQYAQLCKEPATGWSIKDRTFFTYTLSGNRQPLILSVFNKNVLVDRFEVLSLVKQPIGNDGKETTEVLTLRRLKGG